MRTLTLPVLISVLLMLVGCFDSNSTSDAGPDTRVDGGGCDPFSVSCVSGCNTDFIQGGVCVDGVAQCEEGMTPVEDCPPDSCMSAPPAPREGETCDCISGSWVCEGGECPARLDPRNPDAPGSSCRVRGATCGDGGSACGSALFCECDGSSWQCAVAEPDPACYCGREPDPGSPCVEEGMSCGECCPTSGGTGWDPMVCSDGVWEPSDCPAVECDAPEVCAANTLTMEGQTCGMEGQACGDPCCGDSMMCEGGRWVRGPDALCAFCDRSFTCGGGFCTEGQVCNEYPGPDDGPVYECRTHPDECADCDCLRIRDFETCEMVEGRAYVRAPGFGG